MRIPSLRRTTAAKSMLALVASVAFLVSPLAANAEAQDQKPIAVVTLNNINSLLEDINFVGSLGGQPRLADQVRPVVGMLQGLDNDQPIGLVVQTDGVSPGGAVCLPVKDLQMLLGGLQMFGVTNEDGPNGLIQIGAQGQTLFAKEANGWAYISMMPQMLENVPANPGELFGTLTKDYDLGIRVFVQNIPEAFKQMAVSQLEAGMQMGMQKLDNETDEQFEARKEMTQVQVDQLKQAVQDLNELTLGFAVDAEQQRVFLDIAYTAVAGTKLAEQIELNNDPKTNYAGFFQPDAAMMLSMASKMGESDIAQVEQMFGAMTKQIEAAIDEEADLDSDEEREVVKSAIGDFMASLQATLQAGKIDGGAVLNVGPTALTFVAGGFNGAPAKVENGIKSLSDLLKEKEPKFPGFNWDADSHAGVKFHTANIPIEGTGEDEESARKLFGETVDIAIGIGKESVYFALGRDCLEAAKSIIDTSAAAPQKSIAPMEMSFALSQIMETIATFADGNQKPQMEMMANMLKNESGGRDHVRIVVQPVENGARTRIELEEGVLRSLGMAAMAAQMEAAGAGGF